MACQRVHQNPTAGALHAVACTHNNKPELVTVLVLEMDPSSVNVLDSPSATLLMVLVALNAASGWQQSMNGRGSDQPSGRQWSKPAFGAFKN
jgi:hypothetical protein